jgi:hypothetical protein
MFELRECSTACCGVNLAVAVFWGGCFFGFLFWADCGTTEPACGRVPGNGIGTVLFQNAAGQYFGVDPEWNHIDVRVTGRFYCLLWGEPGRRLSWGLAFPAFFAKSSHTIQVSALDS